MPFKDKAKRYAAIQAWRERNPDKVKQYAGQNYVHATRTGRWRQRHLRVKYGLTLEAYDEMVESQQGHCAICFALPKKRPLAVDHDHVTGRVRELLCHKCNMLVGVFEDKRLMEAITSYVYKHRR